MTDSDTDRAEFIPDSELVDRPDEYLETQWLSRD